MQIRQLFADTVQISAVKVIIENLAVGIRQIDRHIVLVLMHPVWLDLPGQITGSGLIKTIWEDLIHDRARTVIRDGKFVLQDTELPEAAVFHVRVAFALLEQAERAVLRGDMEVIEIQSGIGNRQFPAPGIVERIVQLLCKRDTAQFRTVFRLQNEADRRCTAGARDHDVQRADLLLFERSEGRFEL